ncbi:GNAT family N-acetyltransferase [Mucilaginibacter koreensis]
MITVVPVKSKKELGSFIDFPHDLYEGDPNYVPELFIAQRDLLTKHPFVKHNPIQCFLAYRNNKVVGRIAAILNNHHNEFNKANDGFFGFFDSIDDQEVADALVAEVVKWLQDKKVSKVIGPVNFSTNEPSGLLIDGFDSPPMIQMTYNAPYYTELLEKTGLIKQIDLIAYAFGAEGYNDKSFRMLDMLQERLKRSNITIRNLNMKDFKNEVTRVREIYNSAWDKNSGFVPMTDEEFDYVANDLKLIVDPAFCSVAEHEGKAIGFALTLPDINQVLIKVKRGRLFPTGIFKLLFGRKKINGIRIYALGVLEGYRKRGIEAVLYGNIIKEYKKRGFQKAEASWILENNDLMKKAIIDINGEPYKTYRLYEKAI